MHTNDFGHVDFSLGEGLFPSEETTPIETEAVIEEPTEIDSYLEGEEILPLESLSEQKEKQVTIEEDLKECLENYFDRILEFGFREANFNDSESVPLEEYGPGAFLLEVKTLRQKKAYIYITPTAIGVDVSQKTSLNYITYCLKYRSTKEFAKQFNTIYSEILSKH